jgi:hypothetical protein
MNDINLKGLTDIKADQELIERTVNKVMKNNKSKSNFSIKKSVAIAASVLLMVGAVSSYPLYKNYFTGEKNSTTLVENKGVTIPEFQIKSGTSGIKAKMVPLVVYKGKIYLQSNTQIAPEKIKSFLGSKIGKTIGNIDEWNVKDKSSQEMASNIGEQDIYTVKGYDSTFRIMAYSEVDGSVNGEFFDNMNGITIKSGKDIFGKLNIEGNIQSAKFMGFDDWNNGSANFSNFKNISLLNEGIKELNAALPYSYDSITEEIDNSRNNQGFRQIIITLKDGCETTISLFKNGYISYGMSNIYFKVGSKTIDKFWQ